MKVCQQQIGRLELMAREDEKVGRSVERFDPSAIVARRFQQPQARGAHGDDAAPACSCRVDGFRRFLADKPALCVDAVIGHKVAAHGQKSSGADVKRQRDTAHSCLIEPSQQGRGEMQPCGRCRHRASLSGEDRLVVIGVLACRPRRPVDVGRQRQRPGPVQCLRERLTFEGKPQPDAAAILEGHDYRFEPSGSLDVKRVSDTQPPRIAGKRMPASIGQRLVERNANPRIAPHSRELGWNDPGVIRNQQIAGPEQFGQITYRTVGKRLPDHQQTGDIPWPRRMLSDPVGRKVKIEVAGKKCRIIGQTGRRSRKVGGNLNEVAVGIPAGDAGDFA